MSVARRGRIHFRIVLALGKIRYVPFFFFFREWDLNAMNPIQTNANKYVAVWEEARYCTVAKGRSPLLVCYTYYECRAVAARDVSVSWKSNGHLHSHSALGCLAGGITLVIPLRRPRRPRRPTRSRRRPARRHDRATALYSRRPHSTQIQIRYS